MGGVDTGCDDYDHEYGNLNGPDDGDAKTVD